MRLPTEFEWEKAARGTDGREYPYGEAFDANKGNIAESNIKQTTPVKHYPNGASPYDVLDMSGNVWEWCLTNWDHPARQAVEEILRSGSWRGLRGGSWNHSQSLARAAFRFPDLPGDRDYFNGFRLVHAPAP